MRPPARQHPTHHEQCKRRRGTLLVLVLVVVAMLSLSGYAFTEMMFVEHMAVTVHSRKVQATANAESGVELVKALLALPPQQLEEFGGLYDNPDRLRGVLVNADEDTGQQMRFTVLTTQTGSDATESIRYGLTDESTKLNLAAVLDWDRKTPGAGRTALMALPNMTEETADHLLDWIDADNVPREFGGEISAYSVLDTPYGPHNGMPRRLEELLLVLGVSRPQLLGFDVNHNGRIDPIEQSEDTSIDTTRLASFDGAPWVNYLTLTSAEGNKNPEGQPKLNLNTVSAETLTHLLPMTNAKEFAEFVVAYRTYGPEQVPTADNTSTALGVRQTPPPRRDAPSPANKTTTATPATIDESDERPIRSFFDLVDSSVHVPAGPGRRDVVLQSPITSSSDSLDAWLAALEDWTTTSDAPRIVGRINVNGAPSVVLRALPGLDENTADAIASRRGGDTGVRPRHLGWLLSEGILDLEQLRQLAPFATAAGDVYSFQTIGYFDSQGPVARYEVTVDATSLPAAVISWNDLGSAPLGFGPEELGVGQGPSRRR